MRPTWDEYFMLLAKLAACRSTCNSRPNGAVIVRDHQVLATGYNGACAGEEHCLGRTMDCPKCAGGTKSFFTALMVEVPCNVCDGSGQIPYCHRRAQGHPNQDKQRVCVSNHAEANAIAMAAKSGIAVSGADIYCTMNPCFICAKLLHTSEIKRIYYEYAYDDPSATGLYDDVDLIKLEIRKHIISDVSKGLSRITAERRLPQTE